MNEQEALRKAESVVCPDCPDNDTVAGEIHECSHEKECVETHRFATSLLQAYRAGVEAAAGVVQETDMYSYDDNTHYLVAPRQKEVMARAIRSLLEPTTTKKEEGR